MSEKGNINEYIDSFLSSQRMTDQVAFYKEFSEESERTSDPEVPWPVQINEIISAMGIEKLYSHQAEAVNLIRSGKNVVTATPTASGKTLVYNLPVIESVLEKPETRALYLFPLKALAQDQLKTFNKMSSFCPVNKPTAKIYDGDTTAWHRKKIRENPPNVIFSNPDMLHLSILPYHEKWAEFLSNLKYVIIDEVHTYRGVMGSHMAQVFRRLIRICRHYGSSPIFVFSSATIANPGELSALLTGFEVETITESGAPKGKRHIVFIDPDKGPSQTAIQLLKAALHRKLRTIVYTQSRKMAELISIWAQSRAGQFIGQISPYRAGYLPEERREIETRLTEGDLLAVISTSALELGIDIGDLDLCIMVGYPGTVMATWQRGGRVGRNGQDSAWIMIAGQDALDQYFMRNPVDFIEREPESAVINPYNPKILERHLVCAAAELPINSEEEFLEEGQINEAVTGLEEKGELLRSAEGDEIFSTRKVPHRDVDLRGTGSSYTIISSETGKSMGDIDAFRAFRETHTGAVYIHNGVTHLVETLDIEGATVKVVPADVDYYTKVRADKTVEILEVEESRNVYGTTVFTGKIRVTDQVTGFERWRIGINKKTGTIPLDLPPLVFETETVWFVISHQHRNEVQTNNYDFLGAIHALEHTAIGIFPLFVLSDRNDLGGYAIPWHPQTGLATVFIYDGVPGGAGLSFQSFEKFEEIIEASLKMIQSCDCEDGCPSCVHSPKCGSGNRPIDKYGAKYLSEEIINGPELPPIEIDGLEGKQEKNSVMESGSAESKIRYGVFDIETQRSFQEVGGWHRANMMGISCIVLYDSGTDEYVSFSDAEVPEFTAYLEKMDLVIGFNNKRFDNLVLKGYSDFNYGALPTLDILEEVKNTLGYRLSLDHLAGMTLGEKKTADGLIALKWWKEGRIEEIIEYCRKDVEITKNLYLFGRDNGYLLFESKNGKRVRVPVSWT